MENNKREESKFFCIRAVNLDTSHDRLGTYFSRDQSCLNGTVVL